MARRILAGFLITFAMITTVLTPVVWVVYDLTIDTNTLVSKAEELTSDEDIRRAINTAFVTAIFSICEEDGKTTTKQADSDCTPVVETWVEDAGQALLDAITDGDVELPSGAAAAATAGAQNGVLSLLNDWDYSATLAPVWETALASAHEQLTDPDSDEVTLGLHEVLLLLQKEGLVTSSLSDRIEDLPIPSKYTEYVLFTREQVPQAWQAVELVRTLWWLMPLLAGVFLAGALAVSPARWRLLGTYGTGVTAISAVLLLALSIAEGQISSGITTAVWRDAAQSAWEILVSDTFRQALIWTAVIFAVVAFFAYLLSSEENREAITGGLRRAGEGIRDGWDRVWTKGREIAERSKTPSPEEPAATEEAAQETEAGAPESGAAAPTATEEPVEPEEPVDVGAWIRERMPVLLLAGGGVLVLMFLFWPEKNASVFLVMLLIFGAYAGALYAVERFELGQTSFDLLRGERTDRAAGQGGEPVDFDSRMAALERLAELREKGVLTDDEFAEQKARILSET